MSETDSSVKEFNRIHAKLVDAVKGHDDVARMDTDAVRRICGEALSFVCNGRTPDEKTAFKLLIPTALFCSQVMAARDEQPRHELPLEEAITQALALENPDLDLSPTSNVREFVRGTLHAMGNLGYEVRRQNELTPEEADSIEKGE